MVVKKSGSGYKAFSKSGRPLSKKIQTKAEARKQIAAIEISKKKRKK